MRCPGLRDVLSLDAMALVFVYGTLMSRGANHEVLLRLDAKLVSPAETLRRWALVDLGPYPAILSDTVTEDVDKTFVVGELYRVRDDALGILDDFEGCPDLYTREEIDLRCVRDLRPSTHLADTPRAFTYVLRGPPPPSARLIASGRYRERGSVLPHGAKADQLLGSREPPETR